MSDERVTDHFREQARFCAEYGSPFTGDLVTRMADDIEANGPTAQIIGDWPTNPRADALALRLAGALHSASLSKRDPALHALYPAQNPDWRLDEIWPVARACLERERAWVQDFIKSPPQTNETRRAIALLAGFLAFAQHWKGPIDTLEIGASAGLNLNWDRFAYRTQNWSWGQGSPVVIDTDWNGAPPPLSSIAIRNRAACDLNPLDIRDEAARLQLKSYIWPDQADRLTRFDGAVALALQHDTRVDRADAAQWLAQKLATRAKDAATIVYHSVFLQYPPREAREAIVSAIQEAGAKATSSAPIAWVRLEPEAVTDGIDNGLRFVVDFHTWPGGARQILAYTDGHVRNVWAA
ncbi:DUF2332 domain-containing protein [Vitreimonas flagellata]|uniref:DUF2332 domain-containing protein n=1 Tax=Vitreimonas flagellata TaxID=2560861 RepID=UPI00107535DF|nr:DUF2332 domain-containing protein [Vitreimonas flagellata]